MLTVADALALPVVQRGLPEVVAGEGLLSRQIRWVHVTEFEDIASVLRGGELLLSTGIGIPSSGADQKRWVARLAERGVAGLIVELGSALREIPRELRQAAVEHDLPLILLRRQIPFVAVTEALHPRITGFEVAELRGAQVVRDRLARVALASDRVDDLLDELGRLLAGPVSVVRVGGGTIYGSPSAMGDAVRAPIRLGADETWATLVAEPAPSVSDAVAQAAADKAAILIALLLRRTGEREALSLSQAGVFIDALVEEHGDGDELALRERAAALDMSLSPGRLLPVVVTGDAIEWVQLARSVRRRLDALAVRAIIGTRPDRSALVAVCDLGSDAERERAAGAIAEHAGDRAQVTVGGTAPTWTELKEVLRGTLDAAPVARFRPARAWHDVAVPDTADLLWSMRHEAVARRFAERRLEPLIQADRQRKTSLLHTLEVFLDHGGHKAESARALHLERQSLYKRLHRIEATLGVRLEDRRTQFELRLALLAWRFFEHLDRAVSADR